VPAQDLDQREARDPLARKLERLRFEYALTGVRVLDRHLRPVADAGQLVCNAAEHAERVRAMLDHALAGQPDFEVDRVTGRDALREVVWAVCPVWDTRGSVAGVVLTENQIPSVHFKAYSVMEAYKRYSELLGEKRTLRSNLLLMLLVSTLLIVFA